MYIGVTPGDSIFGNIADWAQFAAAVVVGYAVWRVSKRTNQLAEAANQTNETLLRLEGSRDQEIAALRENEKRLLFITLALPLRSAQATAVSVVRTFTDPEVRREATSTPEDIGRLATLFQIGRLNVSESVRSRLHYLEDTTAARILRIESAFDFCETMLKTMPSCTMDVRRTSLAKIDNSLREMLPLIAAIDAHCTEACRTCGVELATRPPFVAPEPPTWYPANTWGP